jgi:peptide/nickel transport system substrate-binding protein
MIISKAYYESVGIDAADQNPIGTGPWKLIEHVPAEYMKYEAVENHWRKTPEFKYLTIKGVPEQSTRLSMMKTGDADIMSIPAEFKAELEPFGVHFISAVGAGVQHLDLGGLILPTRPTYDPTIPWVWHQDEEDAVADHFDDSGNIQWGVLAPGGSDWNRRALKVRMALYYAINIDQIIDVIFDGEASKTPIGISGGWAPFDSVYTPEEWEPFPYDPALARQLLEEAGYSDGEISIRLLITPMEQQPNLEQVCEAVARDWEAVGIDVERVMTEYAVQRPIWAARENVDAAQMRIWGPNPEPWSGGIIYGHPTWIEGYNDGYEDLILDELLLDIARTLDLQGRIALHRPLGDYLWEHYVGIPIVQNNKVYALSEKIGHWPLNLVPFGDVMARFEYATHAD